MADSPEVGDNCTNQFVQQVTAFSSQYGSETSISYTVPNLAGKSAIFPSYGDFTQACVFRTYGPWWGLCPSCPEPFKRRPASFFSQDFVELEYEQHVFPTKIEIFETYNPGAVVKVLALGVRPGEAEEDGRWITLWSGPPCQAMAESRIFVPPIRLVPYMTNKIRLELNHTKLEYYTELDAVCLHGVKHLPDGLAELSHYQNHNHMTDSIANELSYLRLYEGLSAALDVSDNGHFDTLPEEVIQVIISYLDVASLCNLAATCRLFYKHCYDPLQYTELDLQPFCNQVSNASLDGLHGRCRHLQRLSLSWCGTRPELINPASFVRFVQVCGHELTCLQLAVCNFVTNEVMDVIATECRALQELDVQCNQKIDNRGFLHLTRLTTLNSLNFYRTKIDIYSLIAVIRCCPDLQLLNLGSCSSVNNFDDVAIELGKSCRNLRCVDFWRARTLSEIGLNALANNCTLLEEIDLGWCTDLRSGTGCFVRLIKQCTRLKKLFLTANRTICDTDLEAIAEHSKQMEQLDILGTREVSQPIVLRVLTSCRKLCFFDISFCVGIDFGTVYQWRQQFPHVSIKKSFQN